MRKKVITNKVLAIALTVAMAVGCSACGKSGSSDGSTSSNDSNVSSTNNSGNSTGQSSSNTETNTDDASEYFADGDFKDVESEEPNATITLSGNEGTISDTSRGSSGSVVTITSKGTYRVTGSSQDVSIVINDDNKSGNIYLVLDNVEMTNSYLACIDVEACDKLVIQSVGENHLTFTGASSDSGVDGAIFAKDDITVNGTGSMNINSSLHGIVCKDDMKITGSSITINADSIGIKSSDSLRIGGGALTINSGHDGIQVTNDSGDSFLYSQDANMTINAGYDGIAVIGENTDVFTGFIKLASGTVEITSGGGSGNSKNDSTSQKGIKCDGNIEMAGAQVSVSSADDAIHGNADVNITSGTINLSTSDDGISANSYLKIADGEVNITKSYEGLEANYVEISGGNISVVASDDGINTAGGSDSGSNEAGPWGGASTDASLTISGGNLYVNSTGDGLDSNGSIYITGGVTIVEGPTGNDNGALDIGDSSDCVASITGGVVLAIGSSGMAVNFNDGTQCSALVRLSGTSGTEIKAEDGSGFSFTTSKNFECVVYSSPDLKQGSSYTISAGSNTAAADFTSSLYYSEVSGMGLAVKTATWEATDKWVAEANKRIRFKTLLMKIK
ncbi:MAG: carbohydrate-binding domain-containing protein [Lachnospiraceae bacterium]|nr:carbohydrate-binding domain-containing protein [Lachnospiraceae bacterium]